MQLCSDDWSERLLEMRRSHLEENLEKIQQYFKLKNTSEFTSLGESQRLDESQIFDGGDVLDLIAKPIYDFTVSLELLQSQKKNRLGTDSFHLHERKSYEIRTLERILIEDDCKYIKQFWGRFCKSFEAVVYKKVQNNSRAGFQWEKVREKFTRDQPIFTDVKRMIESNTYFAEGEIKLSMSELPKDQLETQKNSIWSYLSEKNVFHYKQDLINLRTDLQLLNEFFSGEEFNSEGQKLFAELNDFRERKILWQLKNAVLYLNWCQLLEQNPLVLEGSETNLLPLSLSEISTAKIVGNAFGLYLKPSVELIKLSNLIMTDFMGLLTTLTQIGLPEDDSTVAMSMIFDFDEVFNQKTRELLKYGLKIPPEDYDKITSEYLLKAYITNPEDDQNDGLWLQFRKCFQLVELVLQMRDRILNTNKMKPIMNGLFIIQENSKNLSNADCLVSRQDLPFSKLTSWARSNLQFVCRVMKRVEISIEMSSKVGA